MTPTALPLELAAILAARAARRGPQTPHLLPGGAGAADAANYAGKEVGVDADADADADADEDEAGGLRVLEAAAAQDWGFNPCADPAVNDAFHAALGKATRVQYDLARDALQATRAGRALTVVLPRRWGKTTVAALTAAGLLLDGQRVLVTSSSYRMVDQVVAGMRNIIGEKVMRACQALSRLRFGSAEYDDGFAGARGWPGWPAAVVVDEWRTPRMPDAAGRALDAGCGVLLLRPEEHYGTDG